MRYLDIVDCDIANGEGFRVTLFVSGCSHHCKGCQNPESWNDSNGEKYDMLVRDHILHLLSRDYIDGLTLTGGDPLYESNRVYIRDLCKRIKKEMPDKTIWLYTGYKYEEIKDLEIMKYIDVLVDGEFVEELKDPECPWRGSSNQRIIKPTHEGVENEG